MITRRKSYWAADVIEESYICTSKPPTHTWTVGKSYKVISTIDGNYYMKDDEGSVLKLNLHLHFVLTEYFEGE